MSKCFFFLVTSHTLEHLLYTIYSYSYMTVPPKISLRKFSLHLICHSQEAISLLLTMYGLQHRREKEYACALEFPCVIIANLKLGERVLGNFYQTLNYWAVVLVEIAECSRHEFWVRVRNLTCLSLAEHTFPIGCTILCGQKRRGIQISEIFMFVISLTFCHVAFSNRGWNVIHQTYLGGPHRLWSP